MKIYLDKVWIIFILILLGENRREKLLILTNWVEWPEMIRQNG